MLNIPFTYLASSKFDSKKSNKVYFSAEILLDGVSVSVPVADEALAGSLSVKKQATELVGAFEVKAAYGFKRNPELVLVALVEKR